MLLSNEEVYGVVQGVFRRTEDCSRDCSNERNAFLVAQRMPTLTHAQEALRTPETTVLLLQYSVSSLPGNCKTLFYIRVTYAAIT